MQFPYSNLKKYLESRGFYHISKYIRWGASSVTNIGGEHKDSGDKKNKISIKGQRSKIVINKAKIRIAFFLPENTINIIRNEAHIRLASSMWYAAKYTLTLSYYTVLFVLICMAYNLKLPFHLKPLVLIYSFIILMLGLYYRRKAVFEMREFIPNNTDEKLAQKKSKIIDKYWRLHDWAPFLSSTFLVLSISVIYYLIDHKTIECSNIIVLYLGVISFLTFGALFAKHRIEETIHYQRVREIIYVLETAYLSKIFDDDNLPDPYKERGQTLGIGLNP